MGLSPHMINAAFSIMLTMSSLLAFSMWANLEELLQRRLSKKSVGITPKKRVITSCWSAVFRTIQFALKSPLSLGQREKTGHWKTPKKELAITLSATLVQFSSKHTVVGWQPFLFTFETSAVGDGTLPTKKGGQRHRLGFKILENCHQKDPLHCTNAHCEKNKVFVAWMYFSNSGALTSAVTPGTPFSCSFTVWALLELQL